MKIFKPGYENEESVEATGENTEVTPDPVVEADNKAEKSFKQKDVDSIVAKERKKFQEKNEDMARQLAEMSKGRDMTVEEKESLEKKVEELRTAHMTAEEKAKRERARLEKDSKEREATLEGERDSWRDRYHEATISRAITDAAVKNEAFQSSQIAAILRPLTRLVELTDDEGNGNGRFTSKVKMPSADSEGKFIELDLTVDEAVKHMKDDTDSYGNLFKGTHKSGLGLDNTTTKVGNIDVSSLTPAEYRKHRAAIKAAN